MKIYKEIVKECLYCPKHVGGWSETHCLVVEPARVIKEGDTKPFPKWCPLEDYEESIKD